MTDYPLMETPLYGLIGYPLSHSFSKSYFTEKFEAEEKKYRYENFPLASIHELPALLAAHPQLRGLNVTLPYKESVLPLLHTLDSEAETAGAVNTIVISRKAGEVRLKGYNTDLYGFSMSLKPFLLHTHHRALVLGTGGAAKAVLHVLQKLGIDCTTVSREKGKGTLTYPELNEYVVRAHPLIVNATPLGMWPHTEASPQLPYEAIGEGHLLYDLVYNPPLTSFLAKGQAQGATTLNGLSMLHLQAEKAWEIWQEAEKED